MRNIFPMSVLLGLLALPVGAWSQYGQSPDASQPGMESQDPSAEMTAEGTLSSVDAAGKMITITTADGSEQHFQYTDQTQVAGADGTVEGLANESGKSLRVTFQSSGGANTATKIELL
jgi:hypothetical protein